MSKPNSNTLSLASILAFLGAVFFLWRAHLAWAGVDETLHLRMLQNIRGLFPVASTPSEIGEVTLWVLTEERILVLFCVFSIALCLLSCLFAFLARSRKEASHLYAGPVVLSLGIAYMSGRLIVWMPISPY